MVGENHLVEYLQDVGHKKVEKQILDKKVMPKRFESFRSCSFVGEINGKYRLENPIKVRTARKASFVMPKFADSLTIKTDNIFACNLSSNKLETVTVSYRQRHSNNSHQKSKTSRSKKMKEMLP